MDELERQSEQQRLELVLREIREQLELSQGNVSGSRKELRAALDAYWERPTANVWDQAQQIEAVARQRSLTAATYQKRARLEKLSESPYFGRIDFREEAPLRQERPEAVYIGIASLVDRAGGAYLIYDWRSPIAGMFYDFEPGPAKYLCPAGTIRGEITLKRQYKIVAGRMLSLFDTDLQIDDEILQEILGRSADSKMRTIVASIQREQNRIIRDETHGLLLVQGPAGSGKTSIALHRAAYLLYLERNAITAKNILILSPNQIFSDYISGVLPELGEENVLQTTFREYILSFRRHFPLVVEERDAQLEYLLAGPAGPGDRAYAVRAAAVRYKSSPEFAQVIRNCLADLETELSRDCPALEWRGRTIMAPEEWRSLFRETLAYLPPTARLAQIKKRVQIQLRPSLHELRREKEAEIAAGGEEVNEKTIKALARLAAHRELEPLLAELDRLTTLIPFERYRRIFEDDALFARLTAGNAVPPEWPAIKAQTLEWFDRGFIPYEDLLPLIYCQGMLDGFPVRNGIRYLIIDEAQDYSALQYEILKRLFPEAAWTVLGDPAQAIHPYFQTADFEAVAAILGMERSLAIRLQRSYRSTREIQSFCQGLLVEAAAVEPINRSGDLPELHRLASPAALPETVARLIGELRAKGCRSLAVICKTAGEAAALYAALPEGHGLSLITREAGEFRSDGVIIPIYLAKGLEFDGVLIPDASAGVYSAARPGDRQLLYIACTRALHRLVLCHSAALSPYLANLDPGLYRSIP